jgi:hypothetical protein
MTPAVSEEMVERAARAICTARCRNPDEMLGHIDDVDGKYPYWILFKPDAIAALSTLAPSAAPSDIPTAEQARERQRDIVRRNPEDFAEPYDPPSAEAAQPVAAMWRRRGKWKWFYRESPPPTDDTSWLPLYDEYAIAAISQGELREGMVESRVKVLESERDALTEKLHALETRFDLELDAYAKDSDLAAARERVTALEKALAGIEWKSADRDNMEFTARITCYQMDALLSAKGGET